MTVRSFPYQGDKYKSEAVMTPENFVAYINRRKKSKPAPVPECLILCYQKSLLWQISQTMEVTDAFLTNQPILLLDDFDKRVAIAGEFGIGAPAAVSFVENMIASGVKKFVSVGTAGALQPDLKVGHMLVCNRAIRDEGTSFHYLPGEKYSTADPELTAMLKASLKKSKSPFQAGTTWTTDAPYRETKAEILQYQREGVLSVDMETAALFAVAKYRKVKMAALFAISDSLADLSWTPGFHFKDLRTSLTTLIRTAAATLMQK